MNHNSQILGVDIGGSHITAALVELKSRSILTNSLVRTEITASATKEEIIADWSNAIVAAFESCDQEVGKIGIAMPGPVDYENGICLIKGQDKYEALYGLNIKELLADQLGIDPKDILMMNDAACFLQGEIFGGAGYGFDHVVGLTLGTGLGTATYHDGIAVDADLWNLSFKDSYAEAYLSTRWFINRYHELYSVQVNNVKELVAHAVIHRNMEIFKEFGTHLAGFLVAFLGRRPADLVVIGGNIAKSFSLFESVLKKEFLNQFPGVQIKEAKLGESAALIGAASLWFDLSIDQFNLKV